jgi:hypothetical protein
MQTIDLHSLATTHQLVPSFLARLLSPLVCKYDDAPPDPP